MRSSVLKKYSIKYIVLIDLKFIENYKLEETIIIVNKPTIL